MRTYIHPDHPGYELYTSGSSPRLLITSGMHGDEYETIDILTQSLAHHHRILPPFLYIPVISPSAVQSKTRHNENKLDLNRIFFSKSSEPEVRRVQNILADKTFDMHVSFHEDLDPAIDSYYIYDIGHTADETESLKVFNASVADSIYTVLNGVDDPADETLGYEFTDGYRRFAAHRGDPENGTFEDYTIRHHGVQNVWVPEIPGLASTEVKRQIIEKFVRELLST